MPDGEFKNVPTSRSRAMSKVRGRDNATTEKRFRFSLVRNGIKGWVLHPKGIIGSPDIYFPDHNIAVFLDGCFWHGCPKCGHIPKTNTKFWDAKITRTKERDKDKSRKLKKQGIKVIRFWEHDLINRLDYCVQKLLKNLNK